MAVKCPECGREYDVTLFEFGGSVKCVCGEEVIFKHEEKFLHNSRTEEDQKILEIKRFSDNISFLITGTDYPQIDIEVEKVKLRERIEELFPDKEHLYELIYEPRFIRLEEQFRRVQEE